MNANQTDYKHYRNELAAALKNTTEKSERRDLLRDVKENPDYYIAYYSKKAGRQLSIEEILEDFHKRDLVKEHLVTDDLDTCFSLGFLVSKYKEYTLSTNSKEKEELKLVLLENLEDLIENRQRLISTELAVKKIVFDIKASVVLGKDLLQRLDVDIEEIENQIALNFNEGKDSSELAKRIEELKYLRFRYREGQMNSDYILRTSTRNFEVYRQALSLYQELIDSISKLSSQKFETPVVSVLDRAVFDDVPKHYISVFHMTSKDAVPSIDTYGLLTTRQSEEQKQRQSIIDAYKDSINPRYADKVLDLSRANCIYAFLDSSEAENQFGRNSNQIILEAKVDPNDCFVVGFESSTRVLQSALGRGSILSLGISLAKGDEEFRDYWSEVVSLSDYMEFYENGILKEGAPSDLPGYIETPEIIITKNVPQRYIRLEK